jgi:Molybdopterin converting factor, small subunit|uniref:MoaD/ThiS family protein n=1 Tax=Thermofilum pendens TaxID=2269 RepID=A0A7C3WQB7_THEPE
MSVRIVYLGYLSDIAGTREEEVVLPDSKTSTVKRVLNAKVLSLGENALLVLVNSLPASLNSTVKPGDTIKVLPHVGGG